MTIAPAAASRGDSTFDDVAPDDDSAMSIPEKSANWVNGSDIPSALNTGTKSAFVVAVNFGSPSMI